MVLDFSSKILRDLTDEEIIEIYEEVVKYKETGHLDKESLLYKKAIELNQESFKNTKEEEIIKVELYAAMKLAEKYLKERK